MSTTYGAPTGLDLSACSVTATGGTTSQTLADLGKAVGDNAAAISTVSSEAASANTTAQAANTTAQAAQTAVSNMGSTYIPQTAINAASGVLGIRADGITQIPSYSKGSDAALVLGDNGSTGQFHFAYNFDGFSPSDFFISDNGTSARMTDIQRIMPSSDGSSDLGKASQAFGNIYSKTAVQVTSDAAQKTVIGSLGDATYTDGQKLASALFGVDTELFKLNMSVAEKGADKARLHAGFIAQKIQSAITAAGLNPSDYALWTNSPATKAVEVDTGQKDKSGNAITKMESQPILDEQGNPTYTQMLRYEELLCVLFEAAKLKIVAQENALSDLTTRVAALEAKAGA